jgi:oligoendopeptidase F
MPWRKPNPERWKQDGTIFETPFYDLDYALAIICSLQIWLGSFNDKEESLKRFFDLCNIGGTKNFTNTIKMVDIKNPFLPETVKDVAKSIEKLLYDWYV